MITLVPGPLVVQPTVWTLVFARESDRWWTSWMALGRYKHVRAYAYVPFLHVWVFYDVGFHGTSIVLAADGEPANAMIARWIQGADTVRMRRVDFFDQKGGRRSYRIPLFGFCVPAIKHLLGLRCVALRPDALYRFCIENGGEPEAAHEPSQIRTATA